MEPVRRFLLGIPEGIIADDSSKSGQTLVGVDRGIGGPSIGALVGRCVQN